MLGISLQQISNIFTTIISNKNKYLKKKTIPCQKISLQQIINIFTTIIKRKPNKKITVLPHTSLTISTSTSCTSRAGDDTALAGRSKVGALAVAERLEAQSALAGGGVQQHGNLGSNRRLLAGGARAMRSPGRRWGGAVVGGGAGAPRARKELGGALAGEKKGRPARSRGRSRGGRRARGGEAGAARCASVGGRKSKKEVGPIHVRDAALGRERPIFQARLVG